MTNAEADATHVASASAVLPGVMVRGWRADDAVDVAAVGGLLGAYLVATEGEKGVPVPDASSLPARYRTEVEDPVVALAGSEVLVAVDGHDAPVGCVVLCGPREGGAERAGVVERAGVAALKRLWVEPSARGRGLARALVGAAIDASRLRGDVTLRLTVWRWRDDALGLYRRLGFVEVPPWESREGLLCLERALI